MDNITLNISSVVPNIKLGDIIYNKNLIIDNIKNIKADIISFSSLSLTGCTCGDMYKYFIKASDEAIKDILDISVNINKIIIIGNILFDNGNLYDVSTVIYKGKILAYVPKTRICFDSSKYNKYGDYYNDIFTYKSPNKYIKYDNYEVLLSEDIIFDINGMKFAIINGFDCFSNKVSKMVFAGADLIINNISNYDTINSFDDRRELIKAISKEYSCIIALTCSGGGESSTDFIFTGDRCIYSCGSLISSSGHIDDEHYINYGYIVKQISYNTNNIKNKYYINENNIFEKVIDFTNQDRILDLHLDKLPFVSLYEKKYNFKRIMYYQSMGLIQRMKAINCKKLVLGISGGLDSCLSLLVCVKAMDMLAIDKKNIIAVSMPCFGTGKKTYTNAHKIANMLGVTYKEIDIKQSVDMHFKDINKNSDIKDVTFENAQARERTQVLMDLANMHGAIVVGTGDLSEISLGFATFNGDHMSMYNVNASIPKTLMRHIIRDYANNTNADLSKILNDIVDTPISPELLPSQDNEFNQKTEDIVGPYELNDFFLYHFIVNELDPQTIFEYTVATFKDEYSKELIHKFLRKFFVRFISQQFKRNCSSDGILADLISLSPRGGLHMPSDMSYETFIKEVDSIKI